MKREKLPTKQKTFSWPNDYLHFREEASSSTAFCVPSEMIIPLKIKDRRNINFFSCVIYEIFGQLLQRNVKFELHLV
jgi:hypothetical protein